jgi:hypothetical protein
MGDLPMQTGEEFLDGIPLVVSALQVISDPVGRRVLDFPDDDIFAV